MDGAAEARIRMLSKTRLKVLDVPPPPDVPSVYEAVRRVAGMAVKPAAVIGQNLPDAIAMVDRGWCALARENSIFAADGTFLISTAGPDSARLGWTTVQWTQSVELAPYLQDEQSPEFIAMSIDGCRLCAVTTEEYDYWIVVHRFAP